MDKMKRHVKSISKTLPAWAIEFRRWGKPVDVARRIGCPVSVILAAYNGDTAAFRDLTAGKYGRKVNLFACVFAPVVSDDRRKRPRWMSRGLYARIIDAVFPVGFDNTQETAKG